MEVYTQDSLRLHLNFDDNLVDQSNYEHSAVALANLEYIGSPCNKAVKITNNNSDAISVSGEVFHQLKDFTLSAYVRIDGFNANNNLISCSNESQSNELIVGYNAGEDNFQDGWHLRINNLFYQFEYEASMNDQDWHHVVIIRRGSEGRLYIDNQQIGNAIFVDDKTLDVAPNGFVVGHDQDCLAGCFEFNQSWFGEIDDLKIFSKALNNEERQNLYCLLSGTSEVENENCDKIYPNPFKSTFTIDFESNFYERYELVSLSGVTVSSGVIPANKIIQLGDNISSGLYILRLYNNLSSKSELICKLIKIND